MTAAARIHAVPPPRPDELPAEAGLFAGRVLLDEQSAALAGRIGAAFLAEAGWDTGTWVLTLPPEHPLLGRTFCAGVPDHLRRNGACAWTASAGSPRPGWTWRISRCWRRRKASAGSAPATARARSPGALARG